MALPLQIDTVRPYLNGQWLQVLAALVPELDAAIARKGRHVALNSLKPSRPSCGLSCSWRS